MTKPTPTDRGLFTLAPTSEPATDGLFTNAPTPTRKRSARTSRPAPPSNRRHILHPGDLVAAGLHHHTCPVGTVTNVTEHGFRLNLHDRDGNPTSGVAVVMWTQVIQFGPVIPNGGKADVGPLLAFRTDWENGMGAAR